jgi:hypothetical protein
MDDALAVRFEEGLEKGLEKGREEGLKISKTIISELRKKTPLEKLSLDELKSVSGIFDETIYGAISVETCVSARNVAGGPAESAVLKAIDNAERFLMGVKTCQKDLK